MFLLYDDVFEEIKQHIAKRFDIQQTVKEVIKEKKVDVPVYEVKEVPVEITQEAAIDFLTKNGWLGEYSRKITDNVRETIESTNKKLYSEYKAKAEAWESAFRLMCGKEQ
jgi:hypothetical protein